MLRVYEFFLTVDYGDGLMLVAASSKAKAVAYVAENCPMSCCGEWEFYKALYGVRCSGKPRVLTSCTYVE